MPINLPPKIDIQLLAQAESGATVAEAQVAVQKAMTINECIDKVVRGETLSPAEMENFQNAIMDLGNVQLPAPQKGAIKAFYDAIRDASVPQGNAFFSQTSILVLMAQIAVLRQKLGQETNVLLTKVLLERLKAKIEIALEQGAAILRSGEAQSETYTQQAKTARAQGVQAITTAVMSGVMAGISGVFAYKFGKLDPTDKGLDANVQQLSQYSKVADNLEQCGVQISTACAKFQEETSLNEQARQTLFKTYADAAKNALDQCSSAMDSVIRKLEEGLSQIPKDTESMAQMQERIGQSMTAKG